MRKTITFAEEEQQRAADAEVAASITPEPVGTEPPAEASIGISKEQIETLANDAFTRQLEDAQLLSTLTELSAGIFESQQAETNKMIESLVMTVARQVRGCIQEKVSAEMTLERAQAMVAECQEAGKLSAEAYIREAAAQEGEAPAEGAAPAEAPPPPGGNLGLGTGLPGLPAPSNAVVGLSNDNPLMRFQRDQRDRVRPVESNVAQEQVQTPKLRYYAKRLSK